MKSKAESDLAREAYAAYGDEINRFPTKEFAIFSPSISAEFAKTNNSVNLLQ